MEAVKHLCKRADAGNSFLAAAIGKFGFAIDFVASVSPARASHILDAIEADASTRSPHTNDAIVVLVSRVIMANPRTDVPKIRFRRVHPGGLLRRSFYNTIDASARMAPRIHHPRPGDVAELHTLSPVVPVAERGSGCPKNGHGAFRDLDLHVNNAAKAAATSRHFDRADTEILLACLTEWPDTLYELIGAISSSQYRWTTGRSHPNSV